MKAALLRRIGLVLVAAAILAVGYWAIAGSHSGAQPVLAEFDFAAFD